MPTAICLITEYYGTPPLDGALAKSSMLVWDIVVCLVALEFDY